MVLSVGDERQTVQTVFRVPTSSRNHGKSGKNVPYIEKLCILKKT